MNKHSKHTFPSTTRIKTNHHGPIYEFNSITEGEGFGGRVETGARLHSGKSPSRSAQAPTCGSFSYVMSGAGSTLLGNSLC